MLSTLSSKDLKLVEFLKGNINTLIDDFFLYPYVAESHYCRILNTSHYLSNIFYDKTLKWLSLMHGTVIYTIHIRCDMQELDSVY